MRFNADLGKSEETYQQEDSNGRDETTQEGGGDVGQGGAGGGKEDGEAGKDGDEQDRLLGVVVELGG